MEKLKKTIAKINVYNSVLGIHEADRPALTVLVAGAMRYLPGKTFCNHSGAQITAAVSHLEGGEPRLAVCIGSWGACALLSRSLSRSQWPLPISVQLFPAAAHASLFPSHASAPQTLIHALPYSASGPAASSATPWLGGAPTPHQLLTCAAATAPSRSPAPSATGAPYPTPFPGAAPTPPYELAAGWQVLASGAREDAHMPATARPADDAGAASGGAPGAGVPRSEDELLDRLHR